MANPWHALANTMEGGSHFAVHFSPILYAIVPFYLAAHSALVLIAVQAAAGALTGPPIYLIARRRTPPGIALGIACIALFYPPLAGVTFTEFHENGLVPATVAWLLYALDARKLRTAFALALVALCIKEDQALFVAFLAAALFVRYARARDGDGMRATLAMVAACIVVAVAYFAAVRPLVHAAGPWHPLVFLHAVAADEHPHLVRALTDRLGYLALAFAPLAFLPLRSRAIVLALPGFAEVLVSRAPVTYTMGQHYAAVWIPYVLVAFALAVTAVAERSPVRAKRLLITCAVLCAIVYAVANPLHPKYFLRPYQPRDAALDRFIATLSPQIDAGTQEEAFTHMGFFPHATLGIECYPRFALFDFDYPDSNWIERDGPLLSRAIKAGRYRLARWDGNVKLYERIGAPPHSAAPAGDAWSLPECAPKNGSTPARRRGSGAPNGT